MLFVATLVRRYKRFLADVILNDQLLTVHCPNTGAMTHCAEPGMKVWLSKSSNPKRKYAYTWEFAQNDRGDVIGIHSAYANQLLKKALQQQFIVELSEYGEILTEVSLSDLLDEEKSRSRIDFQLINGQGESCFVEVKSVTLQEDGQGFFPDTKSERAVKHLHDLIALKQQGYRSVLFFCVQHSGICSVKPADHIYSVYGDVLREAINYGVEVVAYKAAFTVSESEELTMSDYQICGSLPVLC